MVPRTPGFRRRMRTKPRWPAQSNSSRPAPGHSLQTAGQRLRTGSELKHPQLQQRKQSWLSPLQMSCCWSTPSVRCSLLLCPAELTLAQSDTGGFRFPCEGCWPAGVLPSLGNHFAKLLPSPRTMKGPMHLLRMAQWIPHALDSSRPPCFFSTLRQLVKSALTLRSW